MSLPLQVLLVEDDAGDAELIARELRRAELDFLCTRVDNETDYRQALERPWDVVLADFRLPGFDGPRALELAKELAPDTPFVLVSGTIGEEAAAAVIKAGADDYLLKDRLGRLGPAITRAIELCGQRRQARLQTEKIHRLNAELEERVRERTAQLEVARDEAERANRLKSDFLAKMSHELRTPLNGIIGFSQLMVDGRTGALSDTQREYLGIVLSSARHLLQLINDILDLSKVAAGHLQLAPEPFALDRLLDEVRRVLGPACDERDVLIRHQVEPELGDLVADRRRLLQVLVNLVGNAVKFSHGGGKVEVLCRRAGEGRCRIEVADRGIGMSREFQKELFQDFVQEATAPGRHAGTGLGLALSKQLVERMGGAIGASSELGVGSTFWIELPLGGG